ncbi:MAG: glycosyltransferase family 2 protein [Armatimonadota bacterium]
MSNKDEKITNPVLSLCIPTYNRAEMLRSALFSVMPQIAELSGKVEIVVSDNCSDDATPEVVKSAPHTELIRHFRNSENIGWMGNFARCVEEARGEHVWIIGDDDLIREGGLSKVLQVLESYPETDFVYINATMMPTSERDIYTHAVCGKDFPQLMPTFGKDLAEKPLDSWNELIDPDVNGVFLGTIMNSVFRRELWLGAIKGLDYNQPFGTSLASVYAHAQIFAKSMVGRKAYYLGYPYLIVFGGRQQQYGEYLPLIFAVWLHELLDTYERYGVEKWRIEKCRRELLRNSAGAVARLVLCKGLPGKEHFSIWRYLRRFSRYPDLWLSFTILPVWRRLNAAYQRRRQT